MTKLLIDGHNIIHRVARSIYSRGGEFTKEQVMQGFLSCVVSIGLDPKFQTNWCAIFFDSPTNFRKRVFPEYKSNRRKDSSLDRAFARCMSSALPYVKHQLGALGFHVFEVHGFEADDLIASASIHSTGRCVIVTSDSDLWQCVTMQTDWYNPWKQKRYTYDSFYLEFGIRPNEYVSVLAMMGCSSDGVPGIPGVGEVTAFRYVSGYLEGDTKIPEKRRHSIESKEGASIIKRNRGLVQLPFEGCPDITLTTLPVYNRKQALQYPKAFSGFFNGRFSLESVQKRRLADNGKG